MIISGLLKPVTRSVLTAAACVALYRTPVQAQIIDINLHFSNWYQYHRYWAQQCYPEPRYGRWARDRRFESWCAGNRRFRDDRPDRAWRRDHPWDYGRDRDHR